MHVGTWKTVSLCATIREGLHKLPPLCIILGLQLTPADTHNAYLAVIIPLSYLCKLGIYSMLLRKVHRMKEVIVGKC